jgi:hypothetical protein
MFCIFTAYILNFTYLVLVVSIKSKAKRSNHFVIYAVQKNICMIVTLRRRYINIGDLKSLRDVQLMSVLSHNITSCCKVKCTGLGWYHTS